MIEYTKEELVVIFHAVSSVSTSLNDPNLQKLVALQAKVKSNIQELEENNNTPI